MRIQQKARLLAVFGAALLLGLIAYVGLRDYEGKDHGVLAERYERVTPGMSRFEVEDLIGLPVKHFPRGSWFSREDTPNIRFSSRLYWSETTDVIEIGFTENDRVAFKRHWHRSSIEITWRREKTWWDRVKSFFH
jgi:hypothetical protein